MGIISSFMVRQCKLMDILHMIHKNDFRPFKWHAKYLETSGIMVLLLETIRTERRNFFDHLMDKVLLFNDHVSEYIESGYFEDCFTRSITCSDTYFAMRFLELYDYVPIWRRSALFDMASLFRNEFICQQLILKKKNIRSSNFRLTPLDEAVRCNSLNLVCMFLYYGDYTNQLRDNLTTFMFSIMCRSSEDIQRTLFLYEADLNMTCNGTSTLLFAIKYRSPLLLDIIEAGADVNFYNNDDNSVSLAMYCNCDPNIFKIIWEKFDYRVWKNCFRKSVLMKFLEIDARRLDWPEYLKILMENETKLILDLEYYNNYNFHPSDFMISRFYSRCCEEGIERKDIESYIYHLLSHGAYIYERDLDMIFRELNMITPFLTSLLYMDLIKMRHNYFSIMYFKYRRNPDVEFFLLYSSIQTDFFLDSLKYVTGRYSINGHLQSQVLELVDYDYGLEVEKFYEVFNSTRSFPALIELSRDAVRRAIVSKFAIKNSCKLHTIVKHLDIPKVLKNILLLDVRIYW